MTHSDDWYPGQDTGILGHGHDGLVIDRIKHSAAAQEVDNLHIAVIAQATLWAVEWAVDRAQGISEDAKQDMYLLLTQMAVPDRLLGR